MKYPQLRSLAKQLGLKANMKVGEKKRKLSGFCFSERFIFESNGGGGGRHDAPTDRRRADGEHQTLVINAVVWTVDLGGSVHRG